MQRPAHAGLGFAARNKRAETYVRFEDPDQAVGVGVSSDPE